MTFDDDFMQVQFPGGMRRIICESIGVNWPPPERLNILGFVYERVSFSRITDAQRANLEFVVRGAEYAPLNTDAELTPYAGERLRDITHHIHHAAADAATTEETP